MKRISRIILTFAIMVGIILSAIPTFSVMAQGPEEHIKIHKNFSIDPVQDGQLIKPGSIIHHYTDGTSKVFTKTGEKLKLTTSDLESDFVPTPKGLKRANHVYSVPNGAVVGNKEGNTTKISDDKGHTILTIIDDTLQPAPTANTSGWVESTSTLKNNTIDLFDAFWNVPMPPVNSIINPVTSSYYPTYIFNAILPSNGAILQPVLMWFPSAASGSSGTWQLSSWVGWDRDYVRSPSITSDVKPGDVIHGDMTFRNGQWIIAICDANNPNIKTYLSTTCCGTTGLGLYTALESTAGTINPLPYMDNSYFPGSTYFSSICAQSNGVNQTINWIDNQTGPNFPYITSGQINEFYASHTASTTSLKTHNLSALTIQISSFADNNSATMCGTLDRAGTGDSGDDASDNVYLEYADDTYWTQHLSAGIDPYNEYSPIYIENRSQNGNYFYHLTGLSQNTTYHFRFKVVSIPNNHTAYSQDGIVVTTTNLATVTTDASNENSSTITLNGIIISYGIDSTASLYFDYGPTTSYGNEVQATPPVTNQITSFSANISGLVQNQLYHFRTKVVGDTGDIAYGKDRTFQILSRPPSVSTQLATNVTNTTVTLNGYLSDMGNLYSPLYPYNPISTVYPYFEYGIYAYNASDNKYEVSQWLYVQATTPSSLTAPGSFSISLPSLTRNTIYHFNALIKSTPSNSNSDILAVGNENSFIVGASDGNYLIKQIGSFGSNPGQFENPLAVLVTGTGTSQRTYVSDGVLENVQIFDYQNNYVSAFGSTSGFSDPIKMTADNSGNIYVLDDGNTHIYKFDHDGTPSGGWGSYGTGNYQFQWPVDIVFSSYNSRIYVLDASADAVKYYNTSGGYINKFPVEFTNPHTYTFPGYPYTMGTDSSGNIYIGDADQWYYHSYYGVSVNGIYKYGPTGTFNTSFAPYGTGTGQFAGIIDLIVNPTTNKIYIYETYAVSGILSSYLQRLSTSGTSNGKWTNIQDILDLGIDSSGFLYEVDPRHTCIGIYQIP
jgi:hypothetical protein